MKTLYTRLPGQEQALMVLVINPLQWRCRGMDRKGLKQDFGDRRVFHGGGYILAPCHNIQGLSPAENVVAMYETAYEYGI